MKGVTHLLEGINHFHLLEIYLFSLVVERFPYGIVNFGVVPVITEDITIVLGRIMPIEQNGVGIHSLSIYMIRQNVVSFPENGMGNGSNCRN